MTDNEEAAEKALTSTGDELSEDQVEEPDREGHTDHEESQADDRATAGGFSVGSSHVPSMAHTPTHDERDLHWWACAVNAPRTDWRGPCDCDLSHAVTEQGENRAETVDERPWQYAFRADDGPIIDSAFGGLVKFDSYESAQHTGSKWWAYSLQILRRRGDDPWEVVEQGEAENR